MDLIKQALIIDDNNNCLWGTTPWDSRALGINTAAAYDIRYDSRLEDLLDLIEIQNQANNIDLSYFRHDANDQLLKKAAVSRGFLITEMSVIVFHNAISCFENFEPGVVISALDKTDLDGISEVKQIARRIFGHGRFHEDPHVAIDLAHKRFEYWISDLTDSEMIYTYRENGRILGFFSYQDSDGEVNIPLNGIDSSLKGRGRSLMSATMKYIFDQTGINSIRIQISAANMAALNMYARMGFGFNQPTFGYHKYY
ncbi:MAG: GNAT family N-acetyltransferase [Candidatus Saccharibacteria bacterium]